MPLCLKVGARKSALSRAQIDEVHQELGLYTAVEFEPIVVDSLGDLDLITPLHQLEQTDFFTQAVDELILEGKVDFAIHSAKDLPPSLDQRLELMAITAGVDSHDVFVSFNYTLDTLPYGALVGVCSHRRIEAVKTLRDDLVPQPIRGSVDHRLKQLQQGHYDALILAQAGLIRLKVDVPTQFLDHPTHPLQGKLALVALKERSDLRQLFKLLDARLCG
jgi:hydroxymethylbilane synthase